MYLIRLASGREAAFATIQELALAIQRGDVDRSALIFHRRTGEWLPIDRHPQFFAQSAAAPPRPGGPATMAPIADDDPVVPTPLAAPTPAPPAPAPPTPVADTSFVAPTPMAPPIAPPPPTRAATLAPRPAPPKPAPPPAPPEPHHAEPRERGRTAPRPDAAAPDRAPDRKRRLAMLLAAAVIIIGGAGGIVIGLRLRPPDAAAGPDAAGGYRPAPPPSSLVRPDPAAAVPSEGPAPALPAARRGDPLAPVSAESLEARHARSFAASQAQLQSELQAVGLDNVLGVRSFATPEGARAGRRIVAAALNVVGQFHRREVMIDQAYRDTAAFQTTRAGWSRAERDAWDARPTLREAYAAADLAESLLADADSLLSILSGAESYEVRGDTIHFADRAVAASYRAQRSRIAQRSGEPVGDPDRRPTLALVRRSVDPLVLPEGAP